MDPGRVLREARRRAGFTQRALAATVGVPQSMVARIESGSVIPRVDTLDRLLEACGEGLYAEPRLGIGVDRTLAEEVLRARDPHGFMRRHAESMYSFNPVVRAQVAEGSPITSDAEALALSLRLHSVRFIVIGGVAANLLGSPMLTRDFDVCFARDADNIQALVRALRDLGATLRGAPKGIPDVVDERFITNGLNFTFSTAYGPLDCLGEPAGTTGFDDLVANAQQKQIGSESVLTASISDLIRMKRAAGRPKDRAAIEELGALQEIIDERARRERRS